MAERADSYESDILEGFLCPICKADLKSLSRLKNHFQENHPEDQDVLKSLKDLFGKATKKILKLDDSYTESLKDSTEFYELEPEVQEIGYTRSHTKYFKAVRCNRLEHFATETNKLIIRLDQLLLVDSPDRRQHEQNVVHWLDGSSVNLCPQCARSFNLTRRQHHCRLCGTIMCHTCTLFLSISVAKVIISGINENSNQKNVNESDSLRICSHCMEMLDYRRRVQMNRTVQPIICELYNHLQMLRNKIAPDVELYKKMCASLHAGESKYSLADSQALRGSIGKKGETLDAVSKRIAAIPLNPDIPRAVTLQNTIRRATSNYIKDTLLSLPSLPTPTELLEKRNRAHQKIPPQPSKVSVIPEVTINSGWSPVPVTNKMVPESTSDPIVQQMNIVCGYIKQARDALRFEEVASLEAHLRELRDEWSRQQSVTKSAAASNNT